MGSQWFCKGFTHMTGTYIFWVYFTWGMGWHVVCCWFHILFSIRFSNRIADDNLNDSHVMIRPPSNKTDDKILNLGLEDVLRLDVHHFPRKSVAKVNMLTEAIHGKTFPEYRDNQSIPPFFLGVGGLEPEFYRSIFCEFHHPNWRSHIFQRDSNHQPDYVGNQSRFWAMPWRGSAWISCGRSWWTTSRRSVGTQRKELGPCYVAWCPSNWVNVSMNKTQIYEIPVSPRGININIINQLMVYIPYHIRYHIIYPINTYITITFLRVLFAAKNQWHQHLQRPGRGRCYEIAVKQLYDGSSGSTPLWMYYAPWQRLRGRRFSEILGELLVTYHISG